MKYCIIFIAGFPIISLCVIPSHNLNKIVLIVSSAASFLLLAKIY